MRREINLVEFFSGIGSQYRALENLEVNVNTLGICEWDIHAMTAYDLMHNSDRIPDDIQKMNKTDILDKLEKYTLSNSGKEELEFRYLKSYSEESLKRIYASIVKNNNYVDISKLNGGQLPNDIDILTYSFPCQDLSNVGAFHGYKKGIDKDSGSRSSLLWQVGRILDEMKKKRKKMPKFLLMENVPTLLAERHIGNFKKWISTLDDLGYVSYYYPLNASAFGLPQNRPRLLMISVFVGCNRKKRRIVEEYFKKKPHDTDVIADYKKSKYYKKYTIENLIRIDYTDPQIRKEALECTPNDTISRREIWEENPKIITEDGKLCTYECIRTITTKQDRNPNSGNLYFDSGIEGRSKFRYLTPRECMLFMGFKDMDYEKLIKNDVEFHKKSYLFPRDKIIKMAGNSIPVKLLEGIFLQILMIDDILIKADRREQK